MAPSANLDGLFDSTDSPEPMRVQRVAAPLREQVLDMLREAILDFRLKPGQRLIERELIEQTGVSRTTIREVLRQLSAEGLVATIPQKGATVVVPSPKEAAELYEIRGALETLVVRRFVENASAAQVKALRAALEEYAKVTRADHHIRTLLSVKDGLYEVLFDGAGNDSVRSILTSLQGRVRLLRATSLSQPGRAVRALEELTDLVEAIEARDTEGAVRACLRHVGKAADTGLHSLTLNIDARDEDAATSQR